MSMPAPVSAGFTRASTRSVWPRPPLGDSGGDPASNVFMTFAWYGHLEFKASPLQLAAVARRSIGFAE